MKKLIIIFITITICTVRAISMDTTSIKYYPLNTGNIYVYKIIYYVVGGGTTEYRKKVTFTKDTVIHGHKYFYYYSAVPYSEIYWCRTDSGSGSLYVFDTVSTTCRINQYDKLKDSLGMRTGSYNCGGLNISCQGEAAVTIFGISATKLTFGSVYGSYSNYWYYVRNFGYAYNHSSGVTSSATTTLVGCIINGVLYGDTAMYTGLENMKNETPEKFYLFQNYPNPFNPSTKIEFRVQKSTDVSIAVLDVTGKVLITFPYNGIGPGTFEILFDGSNLPSGIYYYCLRVGDELIDTKKMILLK